MISLAREAAFSQIMPLAVHPTAKHGLALGLRTLRRRTLRLGSTLHRSLCWQLRWHRQEEVRSHIARLVRYEGQSIWRAGGREASEITGSGDWHDESTGRQQDGHTCDVLVLMASVRASLIVAMFLRLTCRHFPLLLSHCRLYMRICETSRRLL